VVSLGQMIAQSGAGEDRQRLERRKLDLLLGYCESTRCRRQSLLAAFGAFAAGFLVRPLGGVAFGRSGDRCGRGCFDCGVGLGLARGALALRLFLCCRGFVGDRFGSVGCGYRRVGFTDRGIGAVDRIDLGLAATAATAAATVKNVDEVADDDMILDVGPKTAHVFAALMKEARTIVWNGPVGVFEFDQFGNGTRELAEAIADSDAFSIAGGGDTLAAVDKYGISDKVSYISTGGGAFLEFLEGKVLPAVAILETRGQ